LTLEETALSISLGGAIAIIGVFLGWWLTSRETRKEKRERESKLKRLLVSEVSGSLSNTRIMTWFIEIMKLTNSRPVPEPLIEIVSMPASTRIYEAIARDPTVVPPDVFEKVMPWHEAETLSLRARTAWLVGTKLERPTIDLDDFVRESMRMLEATGVELLRHLGATQEMKEYESLKKEHLDPVIELLEQMQREQRETLGVISLVIRRGKPSKPPRAMRVVRNGRWGRSTSLSLFHYSVEASRGVTLGLRNLREHTRGGSLPCSIISAPSTCRATPPS